jgi:hypothetical protein
MKQMLQSQIRFVLVTLPFTVVVNGIFQDTKLDVLNILANVAGGDMEAKAEVRVALGGISEWFDEYIANEESDAAQEPELHKAMVLLLARCWNYKLKTEDVLELTQGNRQIALCTVVGLLEDGETYTTSLVQRKRPQEGQLAQWEHELNIHRCASAETLAGQAA